MSTPTLRRRYVVNNHEGVVVGEQYADALPADVMAWLLDQGAEKRQWCETHEESGGEGVCYFAMYYGEIRKCRMVSVLVWRTPDSEQVSPTTN